MKPATVHCCAQLLRHQRAACTTVEKWVRSAAFDQAEALEGIAYLRRVLDGYERALARVEVDTEQAS